MTPHSIPARVYWEDTDASGLVYHASYIRFMERGRTELLRSLGLEQRQLLDGASGAPIYFVVRAMQLDFCKPAVLDDLLSVETLITEIGGASLTLDQRIRRREETLATAIVKVVCVEAGRARRMPAEVREKFERSRGAPSD
ncbi:MAG: tol-pal system-associated acyl-CoA thioesterase [Methylocystis sp.]|uniref:tol-pal system-associated acyl-CoA thioesterase n=1 Tax=Methylocystis sp. TaxID=1911079 RepID=UPI003DA35C7E